MLDQPGYSMLLTPYACSKFKMQKVDLIVRSPGETLGPGLLRLPHHTVADFSSSCAVAGLLLTTAGTGGAGSDVC